MNETGNGRSACVRGVVLLLGGLAALIPGQMRERVWARYEREMQDPVEDPPDALRKAEFALGRLSG